MPAILEKDDIEERQRKQKVAKLVKLAEDLNRLKKYPEWKSYVSALEDEMLYINRQVAYGSKEERELACGGLREWFRIVNIPESIIKQAETALEEEEQNGKR